MKSIGWLLLTDHCRVQSLASWKLQTDLCRECSQLGDASQRSGEQGYRASAAASGGSYRSSKLGKSFGKFRRVLIWKKSYGGGAKEKCTVTTPSSLNSWRAKKSRIYIIDSQLE